MSEPIASGIQGMEARTLDDIDDVFDKTPQGLAASLKHFRMKPLANHKEGLANAVARLAAKWAESLPWIKSVYVLDAAPYDRHSAITLLISVDKPDTQKRWACSDFALLMGGNAESAVETCVVEDNIEIQAGYIFSYKRPNAKP